MSSAAPFEAIHPYELGGRGATLKVRLPTSSFARLAPLLRDASGEFAMHLHFERDDRGRCVVTGEIGGSVRLLCQGCAVEVPFELVHEMRTVLVRSDDEARELMPHNDVLVVAEDTMKLVDLLEDELILDLPDVVCGDFANCPRRPTTRYGDDQPSASPFGALARMLGGGDDPAGRS